MKFATLLFWAILAIAVASLVIALSLIVDQGFGARYSPVFLSPSNFENRLKVADFFMGLAGFSAATLALIKTYETIRDSHKAPILGFGLGEVEGALTSEGPYSHTYELPPLGFERTGARTYQAMLDLRLTNDGSLSARDIVCVIIPTPPHGGFSRRQIVDTGYSAACDSLTLQVMVDNGNDHSWRAFQFGASELHLRFDGGRDLDLIPGDKMDVCRLNIAIALQGNPSITGGLSFQLEIRVLSSNAEPCLGTLTVFADPSKRPAPE